MLDVLFTEGRSTVMTVVNGMILNGLIGQFAPERKFPAFIPTQIVEVLDSMSFYVEKMVTLIVFVADMQ
jgi:hypothetical protein